ncbi:MAG: hypothetical protein Q4D37_06405 [Oscillospiraceae bacterium]|nr:hypothetical protein [Oscillospiraceae bacterium]
MLECQVGMQSDTQARKAQALLRRYGYQSKVQRQIHPTPEGCSYLLHVKGDCKHIAALLEENDIPYLSLRNMRDVL